MPTTASSQTSQTCIGKNNQEQGGLSPEELIRQQKRVISPRDSAHSAVQNLNRGVRGVTRSHLAVNYMERHQERRPHSGSEQRSDHEANRLDCSSTRLLVRGPAGGRGRQS